MPTDSLAYATVQFINTRLAIGGDDNINTIHCA